MTEMRRASAGKEGTVNGYEWGIQLYAARRANREMCELLSANADALGRLPGMAALLWRISLLLQQQAAALAELEAIQRDVRRKGQR